MAKKAAAAAKKEAAEELKRTKAAEAKAKAERKKIENAAKAQERKAIAKAKAVANQAAKEAELKSRLMNKTIGLLAGPLAQLQVGKSTLEAARPIDYTQVLKMKIEAALLEAGAMNEKAMHDKTDFTWKAEDVQQAHKNLTLVLASVQTIVSKLKLNE